MEIIHSSYFFFLIVFCDCFARLLRKSWIILGNKHLYIIPVKFSHLKIFNSFLLFVLACSVSFTPKYLLFLGAIIFLILVPMCSLLTYRSFVYWSYILALQIDSHDCCTVNLKLVHMKKAENELSHSCMSRLFAREWW